MVVVDTNVLVYLLIDGDHTANARQLYRLDAEWASEAFLLVEFSNVLATYERLGELAAGKADRLLAEAEARVSQAVNLPASVALRFARGYSVSAYDARFLAAAETLRARLVTEDTKLRAAAPALTQSIADAVSSYGGSG